MTNSSDATSCNVAQICTALAGRLTYKLKKLNVEVKETKRLPLKKPIVNRQQVERMNALLPQVLESSSGHKLYRSRKELNPILMEDLRRKPGTAKNVVEADLDEQTAGLRICCSSNASVRYS